MRINPQILLPSEPQQLNLKLTQLLAQVVQQLNALSEGYVYAVTNAYPSAPTTGQHGQGDFILNSTPTELGTAGSKYIVHGFRCVAGGTPGTWVQVRTLTGN